MPGWIPSNAFRSDGQKRTQVRIARCEISQETYAALLDVNVQSRYHRGRKLLFESQVVRRIPGVRFLESEVVPKVLCHAHADNSVASELSPDSGVHRRVVTQAAKYAGFDE